VDDLLQVKGITRAIAEAVKEHLQRRRLAAQHEFT
jgi:hypothetical protein